MAMWRLQLWWDNYRASDNNDTSDFNDSSDNNFDYHILLVYFYSDLFDHSYFYCYHNFNNDFDNLFIHRLSDNFFNYHTYFTIHHNNDPVSDLNDQFNLVLWSFGSQQTKFYE